MPKITWCSFLGDDSFARLAAAGGPTLLASVSSSTMDPRAIRALSRTMAPKGGTPVPDLLDALDERGFRGGGRGDLDRLRGLLEARRSAVFVGRCVLDADGRFAAAAYRADAPGSVRPGDTFFAGVQASGDVASGVVLVEPHVLRRICANGASIPVASDEACFARWSDDDAEGDLESVVETALSGRTTRDVETDLRRASVTPQPRLSDLRSRGLLGVDEAIATSIYAALREEAPTLYGLYNAMTRVARDLPHVARAVALERTAGRLVAALVRSREPDGAGVGTPALV
jgi:hypothetical protein